MRATSVKAGLLALAAPSLVHGSPVNLVTKLECLLVDVVVNALAGYSSATPFCSSFLQIPTITSTVIATSSVPTTTYLTTTTGTDTVTAETVTVTETESAVVTTCILAAVDKRFVNPQKKTTSTTSTSTTTSTGLPSCVSNFKSAQISTACSCLSIPTPSTTLTSTVTVTPTSSVYISVAATETYTPTSVVTVTSTSTDIVCPTATQCSNQGLGWAEYYNVEGYKYDYTYSTFDPTVFKTTDPDITGVTSTVGGIDQPGDEEISVYGSSETFYSNYFVLDHRGYLFAEITGTYTVAVSSVDDLALVWIGADAYSGWTRDNALLDVATGQSSGSFTIDLVAGLYYPLRIMFAQAQGTASFEITIADPSGTVFIDSSSADSPYIVQYSCDGTTAPAFPAFGAET